MGFLRFEFKEARGGGEKWQGFDIYLLDNRNRTQKWDELNLSFWISRLFKRIFATGAALRYLCLAFFVRQNHFYGH